MVGSTVSGGAVKESLEAGREDAWRRRRNVIALIVSGVSLIISVASAVEVHGTRRPGLITADHPNGSYSTANCSNSVTDATTIQKVIDSSQDGDEIVISGSCLVDSTIKLLGGRTYRGESRTGTVLQEARGANLPALMASDSWVDDALTAGAPVTVRDLTLDGNKDGNPAAGDGLVIRSWQTTIENIQVTSVRQDGIKLTNLSRNGKALTNTQVNGTIRNVFVTNSEGRGIAVRDSGNAVTDWNLLNSWVGYNGAEGILLENTAGWTVEGNHVYGSGTAGISADRLFASCICDNYVEDFGTDGIVVNVQGNAASIVANNRVFQFSGGGGNFVHVSRVNSGRGELAVTGNTIRGGGTGVGLFYQRGANQLSVTSAGNSVTNVATALSAEPGVLLGSGF